MLVVVCVVVCVVVEVLVVVLAVVDVDVVESLVVVEDELVVAEVVETVKLVVVELVVAVNLSTMVAKPEGAAKVAVAVWRLMVLRGVPVRLEAGAVAPTKANCVVVSVVDTMKTALVVFATSPNVPCANQSSRLMIAVVVRVFVPPSEKVLGGGSIRRGDLVELFVVGSRGAGVEVDRLVCTLTSEDVDSAAAWPSWSR